MAATRKANVVVFDGTGGAADYVVLAEAVIYIPGTGSPTATIAAADGTVIWEASGAARISDQICITDAQGITVALAGTGTKLYLYTE